ncbi:hypothetical protein BSKO_12239 [Bryopsis sp. KO-2023]|nr:hypothetical protein BSKO_12239 [Bryopsis sp. KO-2023]
MVSAMRSCTENRIISSKALETLGAEMARRKGFVTDISIPEIRALIHSFGMLTELGKIQGQSPSPPFPQCRNLVILLLAECIRRGVHRNPCEVMFRAEAVYGAGLVFGSENNHRFVGLLQEILAKFLGRGFSMGLADLKESEFFYCVACTLSGCAKLGYVDVGVREIPRMVVERLGQTELNLQAKHLTMLLSAESKLRLSDQMLGALIEKIPTSPDNFDQWALSSVVTALANVRYDCRTAQGAKTMSFLVDRISKELCLGGYTNPGCLADAVVGFGRMRYYDKSLIELLVKGVRHSLDDFSVVEISDVLHNLARVRRSMSQVDLQRIVKPLMRDVAKTLKSALASGATLSCSQISSLCWSMSDFAYLDQDLFLDLVDRWMKAQGDAVSEIQLARMIHSSAVLYVRHEPLVQYTLTWIRSNVGDLKSIQTGTSMLWALFVFDAWPLELFFPLIDGIIHQQRHGAMVKTGDFHRIARCYSLSAHRLDTIQAQETYPGAIDFLSHANAECQKSLYCTNSRFQEEVACVVEELGFEVVRDSVVGSAGCVLADVLVKGYDVVVEADGPSHYAINSKPQKPHPVGATQLRNSLLRTAGYKVVVVPVITWRSLNSEGRRMWLKNSIEAAIHAVPVKLIS